MSNGKMRVEYQEVPLAAVLRYFVKDFEFPGTRERLHDHEAFVDVAKGKVVFKLVIVKDGVAPAEG